jgi:hypothetical protein
MLFFEVSQFAWNWKPWTVSGAEIKERSHVVGTLVKVKVKGKGKGKGQAVPLKAWSDPEGSRKLRFPDFMTTAQDGCKVVSLTHRPSLTQEIHLVLVSVRG